MTIRLMKIAATAVLISGCSDIQQTRERSALLNSSGPQFNESEVADYFTAIENIRKFYKVGIIDSSTNLLRVSYEDRPPNTMTKADLEATRSSLFAYIAHRCDAYVDAIFWAHRTRGGATSANSAIAAATGTIVGATGGSAKALSIIAAAFGLNGSLFDSYYDSVLYGLNPSGIQNLVDDARAKFRASENLSDEITSEGLLLLQVQAYIRLCTPANIEYLVNESIGAANVVDKSVADQTKDAKPSTAPGTAAAPTTTARDGASEETATKAKSADKGDTVVPVMGIENRK